MDFIEAYLGYTNQSEPPTVFHRWCAISAIGSLIGRSYYIPFGHSNIIPNFYTMLIGEVGTRKSTAIKLMKKLVREGGYDSFASEKTTKEKFLLDLEGLTPDVGVTNPSDSITELHLWGPGGADGSYGDPKQVFIAADEFNEFVMGDKLEFYAFLGSLWDWDDEKTPYTYRLKNSKSVSIFQPTINILGGNTQDNFARAFPPEIMGQGFMSRLLIIYGEPSGKKFTFPPVPDPIETAAIVSMFAALGRTRRGAAEIDADARDILDKIYKGWIDLDDFRFKNYSTRRFTQLLKLCLVVSAAQETPTINSDVVLYANTILAAAEANMPKALGEFGKSKYSEASNKIMNILEKANKPILGTELWEQLVRDLDKPMQMQEILHGLQTAKKIQNVPGKGFLLRKTPSQSREFVDFTLLTVEERMML